MLSASLAACGQATPTRMDPGPPSPTFAPIRLGPTSTATLVPAAGSRSTPTATLVPVPTPSEDDWIRGPADAPVSLVIYSDFQCRPCAGLATNLEQLAARHPGDVQIVFRHYPLLEVHENAVQAAVAAEAAGRQGEFWAMHDVLFGRIDEWIDLPAAEFRDWLIELAEELGLERGAFEAGLGDASLVEAMERSYAQALAAGIPGAPFIFLNGRPYQLSPDLLTLEASVRLALLERRRFTEPPPFELDFERDLEAVLELDIGEIRLQLFPLSAPLAVNSFVFLIREGWYRENDVYRVIPGTLIETGDPSGTGLGDPGYYLPTESDPALRFDQAGMVALVSLGPETNSGRFFISLAPLPQFDGTRTIFGRVLEGLDLLANLEARDPLFDLLSPPPATIRRIRLVER